MFFRPGRQDIVIFAPALTSRTAGYVTRSSGGVVEALSDGRPYHHGQQTSDDLEPFECPLLLELVSAVPDIVISER